MSRVFAVFVLALAVVAAGCSEPADSSDSISVRMDGSRVVLTTSAQGRDDLTIGFIPNGPQPAVHFSSFEVPAKDVSNLYMYGLAPAGAASVETVPPGTAKIQVDGTFLAVLQNQAQALPASIHWRFMGPDGALLAQGDGPSN